MNNSHVAPDMATILALHFGAHKGSYRAQGYAFCEAARRHMAQALAILVNAAWLAVSVREGCLRESSLPDKALLRF